MLKRKVQLLIAPLHFLEFILGQADPATPASNNDRSSKRHKLDGCIPQPNPEEFFDGAPHVDETVLDSDMVRLVVNLGPSHFIDPPVQSPFRRKGAKNPVQIRSTTNHFMSKTPR